MKEGKIGGSGEVVSDERSSFLCPTVFGVSCALFSLKRSLGDEMGIEITDKMFGLVGLLLWRVRKEEQVKTELVRKITNAESEIEKLKRRRVEDAKANEKVVSIFAAREQGWLTERKKLRNQIRALVNELRVIGTKGEENELKLNNLLEEEKQKAEKTIEELREALKREAQEHSNEIWKHKSAFIELVSTQRQLEADMGRAVRQIEAEKQEIDAVLEQKEEYVLMTQKLSMELVKTRKDLEQKDKILSAVVRKSNLDTAEKQMLLKEVKKSKMKLRTVPESRYSLRSMLSRHHKSKQAAFSGGKERSPPVEYEQEVDSPLSQQSIMEATEELVLAADIRQLEGWVRCEAEKCITSLEQRHQLEVNAFTEQLRLKDEKLEAFHRHSVSMNLELKRLHSHIEGLGHDLKRHKEQNFKFEALLLDRESELHFLKEQMATQKPQKAYSNSPITYGDTIWSNVRITKRKPSEEMSEENGFKDTVLTVQSPDKEFEDKKDVPLDPVSVAENIWKMDLHALGVFYKIKRLKQQLLMFERLTGKQESCENGECDDKRKFGVKGYYSLMYLINKQVSRYQSLQEKANDICKRMHENDQDASSEGSNVAKSKNETKILEHFLEETFQLQRYIVATGQKLMEIQSKIACEFIGGPDDELDEAAATFDVKKFADCLRSLFREVQRGLEVRISRIIGDLEGPLARDVMIHPRT